MAEVNISDLTEGVAGSGSAGSRRFITALGPMKVEWNYFQQASGDDFAASDTFTSRLARPLFASVLPGNADLSDTAFPGSADLDVDETSSTHGQVTVHDADGTNGLAILVLVVGF